MIRFKRTYSRSFYLALSWILLLCFLAIFQPWLTSENTLQAAGDQASAWRPIPFSSSEIRLTERLIPPLSLTKDDSNRIHWLGTDNLGRDVAAGILKGLRQALAIGFGSMLLTLLAGFFIGGASAWFGDSRIRWTPLGAAIRAFAVLLGLVGGGYLLSIAEIRHIPGTPWWYFVIGLLILLGTLLGAVHIWEKQIPFKRLSVALPLDTLINRFIEFFLSLPTLLLLMAVSAWIGKHHLTSLIFILFLVRWPMATRFIRAEILNIRERAYLQYARSLALPFWKVLFREILPNTVAILIALFAFGVSTAILLESTLTFLGLGLPLEQVSWGSMIQDGRQHPKAWWLILFPGLMIFLTLLSLLRIGEEIQQKWGTKGRKMNYL